MLRILLTFIAAIIASLSRLGCELVQSAEAQNKRWIVTGAGPGGGPHVRLISNIDLVDERNWFAFGNFSGGVRVATGDVNNDGVDDIVTGAGPGGGAIVSVFDGRTNAAFWGLDAFPGFTGGVFVAAGDVNLDGYADVMVGAGAGGGPVVHVYDGRTGALLLAWNAYDSVFRGGVSVALGDINGDGRLDYITGAGPGGGPHVRAFSGYDLSLIRDFFAYDPSFRGGVNVAAGDVLYGDRIADIITGAGPGGGPHVKVFNGPDNAMTWEFFAYEDVFRGGVNVGAYDFDNNGVAEIITGAGEGGGPRVRTWGNNAGRDFFAYDIGFRGGAYVAGGDFNIPQCLNGVDDDGDGLVDLNDPGCSNRKDYNEGDGTSQCQDGVDNDGDGVADLADPGCAGNRLGNNEGAATTQCQDGVDNDGDGVSDLSDPGCAGNKLGNNEGAATTQCQDGVDNDGDGVSDLSDPGCAGNKLGNNEGAATTQCQDGVDNDGDGVSDLSDPGCAGNKLGNNERAATTQCQDGVDNDGDGVSDLSDPGCAGNKLGNNEGAGTTQCQDGSDNDGDGVADQQDPGCWSDKTNPGSYLRTGNNEGAATTQCQDGIDNDGDGLVDSKDPGCLTNSKDPQSYSRTRNTESAATAQCNDGIDNDGDGVKDAQDPGCFSDAKNPNTYDRTRSNEGAATTQCQDGIDNDADGVTDQFDPGCLAAPSDSGTFDRTRNNEGAANPIAVSTATPTRTPAAVVTAVATTAVVPTQSPTAVPTANVCVDQITVNVTQRLDQVALELSDSATRAADKLMEVAGLSRGKSLAAAERDVQRTKASAEILLAQARSLTVGVPTVSRSCPSLTQQCREVSNAATIQSLKINYLKSSNLASRAYNRAGFRLNGNTKHYSKLIKATRALRKNGYQALEQLPGVAISCS